VQDSIWKTEPQRAGDVVQVVEHLSGKCRSLSSNPSTTKNIWLQCISVWSPWLSSSYLKAPSASLCLHVYRHHCSQSLPPSHVCAGWLDTVPLVLELCSLFLNIFLPSLTLDHHPCPIFKSTDSETCWNLPPVSWSFQLLFYPATGLIFWRSFLWNTNYLLRSKNIKTICFEILHVVTFMMRCTTCCANKASRSYP
jgi:hypothetical protein